MGMAFYLGAFDSLEMTGNRRAGGMRNQVPKSTWRSAGAVIVYLNYSKFIVLMNCSPIDSDFICRHGVYSCLYGRYFPPQIPRAASPGSEEKDCLIW